MENAVFLLSMNFKFTYQLKGNFTFAIAKNFTKQKNVVPAYTPNVNVNRDVFCYFIILNLKIASSEYQIGKFVFHILL